MNLNMEKNRDSLAALELLVLGNNNLDNLVQYRLRQHCKIATIIRVPP